MLLIVPLLASLAVLASSTSGAAPPQAPKRPVTNTYHGVDVVDDYQYLEDWADLDVQAFSSAQNAAAREFLDALPGVDAIRARITELRKAPITLYSGLQCVGSGSARKFFAFKTAPPAQQAFLVGLASPDDRSSEWVVADPNVMDPGGGTSFDWFVVSPDGSMLAVSVSSGGSERGDVMVFDSTSGKQIHEIVPRVNYGTAGGSLAWAADSKGFYYTRYPRGTERPPNDMDFYVQIYFHRLGTPTDLDEYQAGRDFPRIAEIVLECSKSGRVVANVQKGDGGEFIQLIKAADDGDWTQITTFGDGIVDARFGPDGESLFLLSRADAPNGRLLRLPLSDAPPSLKDAKTVIDERSDAVIDFDYFGAETIAFTDDRVFINYQRGGPSSLESFSLDGTQSTTIPTPHVSGISELVTCGSDLLVNTTSFTEPSTWWIHPALNEGPSLHKLAISTTAAVDFSDCEIVREMVTSKDGARVPLNILKRKGTPLDGNNPVLLTAYGGYGISLTPSFRTLNRLWIDQGGVWALANIRGGGEFGESWHRAGYLTSKQNVFDDFLACAEYLVATGYTRPARLAIEGGSNGGLLMGAAITQRPDLFGAVVSHVGIFDMLRVELSPNGAFNTTEFGTVKDAAQFAALHAYSPYHHVVDGTKYPPILFLTGANDPRVDPMHSRKMTARVQAANPGGIVLLRTSAASGHGSGTSLDERIEQDTDVFAFLFKCLNVDYKSHARLNEQRAVDVADAFVGESARPGSADAH